MSVSESLRKLSERAKLAEDHAAAAKSQARADLEKTVDDVRAQAEAGGEKVQAMPRRPAATWLPRGTTCSGRGRRTSTR